MSGLRAWGMVAVVLVLSLVTSLAAADVRDEARELAKQGVAALQEGKHAEAVDLLKQAEAKFHAPTHLLYMAQAFVGLGQLDEAHRTYVSILVEEIPNYAPPAFHKAKETAATEANNLVSRIASVRVEVSGPEAGEIAVSIDGSPIEAARLAHPIAVSEGSHRVEASAPGFATSETEVEARKGETAALSLTLQADAGAAPADVAAPSADEGGPDTMAVGVVLLGVGGAALIAGAVTGALTLSKAGDIKDRCVDDVCPLAQEDEANSARVLGNVSTAMFVIGGVAAATGLVLVLVDGGGEPGDELAQLQLGVGPASLSLSGRF